MTALDDLLDPAELADLRCAFPQMESRHVVVDVDPPRWFFDLGRAVMQKERRGEVVLVVANAKGQVLLHTKGFYPAGVYRLLTGGVGWQEPAVPAAERELQEETGLSWERLVCLGVLTYEARYRQETVPFASYIFQASVLQDDPHLPDDDEDITDFRWASAGVLGEVAEALRRLPAEWAGWGRFRAVAHDFVAEVWARSR